MLRGNPPGGKSAPLLRGRVKSYAETPLGRPFGAPQKGQKRVKKGSKKFFTLAAWVLGPRALLRGAPYAESYTDPPPPGVNVRPLAA